MKVSSLFNQPVVAVEVTDTLLEAARVMRGNVIGCVAVIDQGRLTGILTERDLVAALASDVDPRLAQVVDHMTPEPVTARPDEDTSDVARRMLELGVRHLPVVDGSELVGMISARNLLLVEAWPGS